MESAAGRATTKRHEVGGMEADFWHRKWAAREIGFHEKEVNVLLAAHFERLALGPGGRVFLPLCGKTRDIAWLLQRGCRVAGIELSEVAIGELFEELGVTPEVSSHGALRRFRAEGVEVFGGDFFELQAGLLGPVDAVYDRAALVALPVAMRARYAAQLMRVSGAAPQLLLTFEYDQTRMEGPPFSVDEPEIRDLYASHYRLTALARQSIPGGFKGKVEAYDRAWLLARGTD